MNKEELTTLPTPQGTEHYFLLKQVLHDLRPQADKICHLQIHRWGGHPKKLPFGKRKTLHMMHRFKF